MLFRSDVESWVKKKPMTNDQLIVWMDETKAGVRRRLDAVRQALAGWKPVTAEANALVDRAQVNIAFVVRDGSFGVHNAKKANAMLDEALALARKAAVLSGRPLPPVVDKKTAVHAASPLPARP